MNCKSFDISCDISKCQNKGKHKYTNEKFIRLNCYSLFEPHENIKQHYTLKEKETVNMENYKTINKIGEEITNIDLENVPATTPIFAMRNGELHGMVIKETNPQRWILMIGGSLVSYGTRDTREECIKVGQERGLTFITP